MEKAYDSTIREHYQRVAEAEGSAPTSTMADLTTRKFETDAILSFVGDCIRWRRDNKSPLQQPPLKVCDVGCGNGYTLEEIAKKYPDGLDLTGVELSRGLREIAESRLPEGVIEAGDVREDFAKGRQFDIIICQRVLINLLDPEDQKVALNNIVNALEIGGTVLFIEAFSSALANLNKARAELGLDEIPPAEHNLYLPDNFFVGHPALREYHSNGFRVKPNQLSTHYFTTRVFLPLLLGGNNKFIRNSEFAKFFSEALPSAIGDYSQVKFFAFMKT